MAAWYKIDCNNFFKLKKPSTLKPTVYFWVQSWIDKNRNHCSCCESYKAADNQTCFQFRHFKKTFPELIFEPAAMSAKAVRRVSGLFPQKMRARCQGYWENFLCLSRRWLSWSWQLNWEQKISPFFWCFSKNGWTRKSKMLLRHFNGWRTR